MIKRWHEKTKEEKESEVDAILDILREQMLDQNTIVNINKEYKELNRFYSGVNGHLYSSSEWTITLYKWRRLDK